MPAQPTPTHCQPNHPGSNFGSTVWCRCFRLKAVTLRDGKWKRAVLSFRAFRKASGEKSFHVLRCSKDPNDLTVCCGWDNAARMRKFMKSPELRKAMKAAGVIGKPEVGFFSKKEDLSVG